MPYDGLGLAGGVMLLCMHVGCQVAAEVDKGNLKEPPAGWIRPGDAAESVGPNSFKGPAQFCKKQLALLCLIPSAAA